MAREGKRAIRTFLVFAAGVVLSLVASAFLEYLFTRNIDASISRLYAATPPDQRDAFYQRLYRFASVTVFVVDPLVGIIVGVFVGLVQRTRAMAVAACCLIPDFVFGFLGDARKAWAHSARGVSIYAFDHSLPFIAAIVTAALSRYLVNFLRQRHLRNLSEA